MDTMPVMSGSPALLHITGQSDGDHTVPAEVLVAALEGMQQAVYLLAAASQQRSVSKRFRLDAKLKRQFRLVCQLPESGGYSVPFDLPEANQTSIEGVAELTGGTVLDRLNSCLGAVERGSLDDLQAVLPDSRWRDRFVSLTRTKLLPKSGDRWQVGFRRRSSQEADDVILTAGHHRVVREWATEQEDRAHEYLPVIGTLSKIDFNQNFIYIEYGGGESGSTMIKCVYDPSLEAMLVDNRRDLVQVYGQVVRGPGGDPVEINDVISIDPVDVSAVELEVIELDGRRLMPAGGALSFSPDLDDDTGQLYVVEDQEIDLYVCSYTRDALIDDISAHIFFLWDEYANEADENLTPDAVELAQAVRSRFQEVSDAS